MYTLFLVMSFVKGNAWRMVSLTAALFFVLATLSSIITPCQGASRSWIVSSPIPDISPLKTPLPNCHTDKHCLFDVQCEIYCRHHHYGLGSYCETTFTPFVCCCLE
ncbi:hypothetical protein BDA96_05G161600 [Sorghum bicolor]|uniref:Uncharacterized protein n=2 Tax=Sorghum bicolor TaxID=4558 RepID=A0A921QYT9_SORBI|nr:hypothetical protein BDA96_05G161600 [Sorghum bicolor]OQU83628.1 hypothetical protein SORBI_3005G148100 [Sorghum bicolor]